MAPSHAAMLILIYKKSHDISKLHSYFHFFVKWKHDFKKPYDCVAMCGLLKTHFYQISVV